MTGIIFDSFGILEKDKHSFIIKELIEFFAVFPLCTLVYFFFSFVNIDPYWAEFLLQLVLCILLVWLENGLIDLAFDAHNGKNFGPKNALDLLSLKEIEQENSLQITMTPYKHETFKDCKFVMVRFESPLANFRTCEFKFKLCRYNINKTIVHYTEVQNDRNITVTDEEVDNCSLIGLNEGLVIINTKAVKLDSLSSYTFPKPIYIVDKVLVEMQQLEKEAVKMEESSNE